MDQQGSIVSIGEIIQHYQNIIAAIIGASAVAIYNFVKAQHDKTIFKRELFATYNKKYDDLNDNLEKLNHLEFQTAIHAENGDGKSLDDYWEELFESEPTPRPELIAVAFDYINLCSEEYYWYKKGYIEEDVWKCWRSGMTSWHKDLFFLQKIVERERQKNAPYYNQDFLDLFPISRDEE